MKKLNFSPSYTCLDIEGVFPLNLKGFCQNSVSFPLFPKIILDKEGCLTLAIITWKNSTGGENGKMENSLKQFKSMMSIIVTMLPKEGATILHTAYVGKWSVSLLHQFVGVGMPSQ